MQKRPSSPHDDDLAHRVVDLWPVYAFMMFMTVGNGIGVTVTPVLATVMHLPNWLTGALGSIYFGGMFLGYFIGAPIVKGMGYRGAGYALFPAFAFGTLALLFDNALLWAIARGFAGAAVGVSYVIAESWVAARAHHTIRMTALAIYIAFALFGTLLSQALLAVIDPLSIAALIIATVLVACASGLFWVAPVPRVMLADEAHPTGHVMEILRGAPASMAGVFLAGFCFSAFFTFYPAYGVGQGIETDVLPMLGVAVMSGAALLQPLFGRMAERRGAPIMLVSLTVIATLTTLVLASGYVSGLALYAAIALWGAAALTTYPIFSGFAYQRLKSIPTFDTARMVLISYGVAEIISPSLIAQVIEHFGTNGLFGGMAAATSVLAAAAVFDLDRNR